MTIIKNTTKEKIRLYLRDASEKTIAEIADALGLKLRNTRMAIAQLVALCEVYEAGEKKIPGNTRISKTYAYSSDMENDEKGWERRVVWQSEGSYKPIDPKLLANDVWNNALFGRGLS